MEIERLTDPQDARMAELWALMERAFPREERRELFWHRKALKNKAFHCCRLHQDGRFIGLMCYWLHTPFIYLEHLAVTEKARGHGCGHAALGALAAMSPQLCCIAELEPPVDELTRRRCRFYESAGFTALPVAHVQLPYHEDTACVPLVLYATGDSQCTSLLIPNFEHYVHETVMRYRPPKCRP